MKKVPSVKPQPPDDLWEKLDNLLGVAAITPQTRPEGSFTASELAKRRGCCSQTALRLIGNLVRQGRAKQLGIIHQGSGAGSRLFILT
jgi:hypothetical protein